MKIDFLMNDNPYGSTAIFSKHFAEALVRRGIEVRLFHIGGGNFYKAFYAIQNDPPDLTCSFSDITLGNKMPLGDAWGIHHLSFFIDHAVYFLHQLQGNYSLVATTDEEDLAFMKHLGFKRAFFLPHAVSKDLFEEPELEKSYDLVMLGTCPDFEALRKAWDPKRREILEEGSRRVLKEKISCLQVLLEAGVEADLPLLHQQMENYVRGKDRIDLLKALGDFKPHIWGQGAWKKYLPGAHVHRSLPFERALQVMRKSKIVLNSIPFFPHSSHERIFLSYATGAIPFTTRTNYVQKNFVEGHNIVTYAPGDWEGAKENVSQLLRNETYRRAIVDAGRSEVLNNHTWDVRAKALQNALEQFQVGASNTHAAVT